MKGAWPLPMKQRDGGKWTSGEKSHFKTMVSFASSVSPYLFIWAVPGSMLMLPFLAWFLDKRRKNKARRAANNQGCSALISVALTPHHRPARLLIGLVVFILPRCTAACAAVFGDGDKAVFVVAVAVYPPVFLPIAALLQLGMPRRAPPVALNAHAWLTQGHFFKFVLSIQIFGHGVPIVAAAWPVSSGSGTSAPITAYEEPVLLQGQHTMLGFQKTHASRTGLVLRQLRHISSACA